MRPACEPSDPGHCAVGLGASLDWRSCQKQPLPDRRNLLISVVQTNAGHKRGKGKRVTPPPATTPTALTHRCNLLPLGTTPVQRCALLHDAMNGLDKDTQESTFHRLCRNDAADPSCMSDHCIPGEVLSCRKNQPRTIQPCDIYKRAMGSTSCCTCHSPASNNTSQC